MNNLLKKLKKENTLCEIYENLSDSEKFYVGYIKDFDNDFLVFESISENGKNDGYFCTSIDSLIKINCGTTYLKNIEKLMEFNNFTHECLAINNNLLENFLNYIMQKNCICEVELLNDYSYVLTGYVCSIDSDIISLNLIDEYGKPDGVGYAKISDVSCISFGTEDLVKLKFYESIN